jgi:hypothetical protein
MLADECAGIDVDMAKYTAAWLTERAATRRRTVPGTAVSRDSYALADCFHPLRTQPVHILRYEGTQRDGSLSRTRGTGGMKRGMTTRC